MIAKYEMISYEIMFESGSLGFITNLNHYKKATPVECSFDFSTGTGVLKSTNTSTGMWEVNFSTYNTP